MIRTPVFCSTFDARLLRSVAIQLFLCVTSRTNTVRMLHMRMDTDSMRAETSADIGEFSCDLSALAG